MMHSAIDVPSKVIGQGSFCAIASLEATLTLHFIQELLDLHSLNPLDYLAPKWQIGNLLKVSQICWKLGFLSSGQMMTNE